MTNTNQFTPEQLSEYLQLDVYIDNGSKFCKNKDGALHNPIGPAVEWEDGSKFWFQNGELHREDGPAVEWVDGTKEWFKDGDRHREDGPAIEWPSGNKNWFRNGKELTGLLGQHDTLRSWQKGLGE